MSAGRGSFACALLAALACAPLAHAVPLDVYGRLPQIEDVALSPDGALLAFVRTQGDSRWVVIESLGERRAIGALRVGNEKLRSIAWADSDDLMIVTSATGLPWGFLGTDREWSLLQVYDIRNRRIRIVPTPLRSGAVHIMRFISGRVMVRRIDGHTVLFVPGYSVTPEFSFSLGGPRSSIPILLRYDLDTGGERVVREGGAGTLEWLVDGSGAIVAEEDYDEHEQRWMIKTWHGGELESGASGYAAIDVPRLLGFGPHGDSPLVETIDQGDPVWRLLSLKDDTFGPPLEEGRRFDEPIQDQLTYQMVGGLRVDDDTQYVFFDPVLEQRWKSVLAAFPGERVQFISCAADFSRVVARVEGSKDGYRYVLVDMESHQATPIGDVYAGVTQPLAVRRITYPAADGLHIPAYLTLPRGRPARELALIVLPHGGPAARDTAEFDWWSQALADQGYAVLRPNYRGSSLGWAFVSAGFGEWGRKMQTDLSDGVRYLVKAGIVDARRVCIVGASYGGYAALAGVTLDPGVYRCAVAVAGISDLRRMLDWQAEDHGTGDHRAVRYWDRFWGASGRHDPVLAQLSPDRHAQAVDVPVLLIHGRDDTVVPFEQSELMYKALRRAHKSVEFVVLKHEDHWLSRSDTRLQMLESSVRFLEANDPPQ